MCREEKIISTSQQGCKIAVKQGSRKTVPEENCPPTLILILTLNQTLTLTRGSVFLGRNFPDTVKWYF